ncbi:unnamed protein product [Phaeothamnion confervicola]
MGEVREQVSAETCIPVEQLLLVEIYDCTVYKVYGNNDAVGSVRPNDTVVAYEVLPQRPVVDFSLAVLLHRSFPQYAANKAHGLAEKGSRRLHGFPRILSLRVTDTCLDVKRRIWAATRLLVNEGRVDVDNAAAEVARAGDAAAFAAEAAEVAALAAAEAAEAAAEAAEAAAEAAEAAAATAGIVGFAGAGAGGQDEDVAVADAAAASAANGSGANDDTPQEDEAAADGTSADGVVDGATASKASKAAAAARRRGAGGAGDWSALCAAAAEAMAAAGAAAQDAAAAVARVANEVEGSLPFLSVAHVDKDGTGCVPPGRLGGSWEEEQRLDEWERAIGVVTLPEGRYLPNTDTVGAREIIPPNATLALDWLGALRKLSNEDEWTAPPDEHPSVARHGGGGSANGVAGRGGGSGDRTTLRECLQRFAAPEQLDEGNSWYCSRCKEHRRATKTIQIWRLPEVLIIHLKRFEHRGLLQRDKIECFVDFPINGLDMGPCCIGTAAVLPATALPAAALPAAVAAPTAATAAGTNADAAPAASVRAPAANVGVAAQAGYRLAPAEVDDGAAEEGKGDGGDVAANGVKECASRRRRRRAAAGSAASAAARGEGAGASSAGQRSVLPVPSTKVDVATTATVTVAVGDGGVSLDPGSETGPGSAEGGDSSNAGTGEAATASLAKKPRPAMTVLPAAGPAGPAAESTLYDLFAVSNHMGGMGFGHYTAYVRDWGPGPTMTPQWWCCDDSNCYQIPEDRVVSQAAYVLFYRRRRQQATPA